MLFQYPYKTHSDDSERLLPRSLETRLRGSMARAYGLGLLVILAAIWSSLLSWSAADPSLTHITRQPPTNVMGYPGAILSDLLLESLGLASIVALLAPMLWGIELTLTGRIRNLRTKLTFFPLSIFLLASAFASVPVPQVWPLSQGMGGILGDAIYGLCHLIIATLASPTLAPACGAALFATGFVALAYSVGVELKDIVKVVRGALSSLTTVPAVAAPSQEAPLDGRKEPSFSTAPFSEVPFGTQKAERLQAHEEAIASVEPQSVSGLRRASEETEEPPLLRPSNSPLRSAHEPDEDADLPPSLRPQPAASRREEPAFAPRLDADDRASLRADSFDRATDDDSAAIARRFAPANRRDGYAAYVDPPKTGADWAYEEAPTPRASALPRDEILVGVEIEAPSSTASTRVKPATAKRRATTSVRDSASWLPKRSRGLKQVISAPWGTDSVVPSVSPSPITEKSTSFAGYAPKRAPDTLSYRPAAQTSYKRPSLHLLEPAPASRPGPEFTQTVIRAHTRMLKDVLNDYGVVGKVREIKQGPVVTLYELEPQRGTKTSRVIALADDIARAMSVSTARIAAIPGRSAIGIELPNVRRESVNLRDILESDAYRRCDGALPLALGKAIEGSRVVTDLARSPHLLVAGAAGTGKSVLLNAMIQSLIYRHGPQTCRMLLIDPKMIELTAYNDIPHLLCPVITDPHKGLAALNWVVSEMEERHKRMSKLAARNIEIFNNRVNNARKRGEMIARTVNTGFDRETGEPIYEYEQMDLMPMPYIVVVIDEFAGIMNLAGAEVEAAIRRLSATGQAVGIHLIMATGDFSPSTLTEPLLKSLRTKICFRTATKADSRSVLGAPGAEQLLEHGDMLFSSGAGHCARVHTAHVGPAEIEAVADFLRAASPPAYDAGLVDLLSKEIPPPEETSTGDRKDTAFSPRAASPPRSKTLFTRQASG